MNADDKQLAAAECIDVLDGAVTLLERIREDTMEFDNALSKEVAVVQEALRSVIAKLEEIHDEV